MIEHISVSQVKTHARNPRRWALQKLLKLPTAGSHYTKLGKDVHTALEETITNNLGPGVYNGIVGSCVDEFLEHSTVDYGMAMVEREIRMPTRPGLPPFLGYIDVFIPGPTPRIVDHKTSRTKKYFLKEEDLQNDPQMLVYAKWALDETGADRCTLQHNQFAYSLKRRKFQEVVTEVTREHVEREFAKLLDEVQAGIRQTMDEYEKTGVAGLSTAKCNGCRNAFGPRSCEYYSLCCGNVTEQQYRDTYAKLAEDGEVMMQPLQDALDCCKMFEPMVLTEKPRDVIISTKEKVMGCCQEKSNKIVLSDVVAKAREKYANINDKWDRSDKIIAATVHHVTGQSPDIVLLPSHFINGTLDYEYQKVVTQLTEKGIQVAVILNNP